MLRRSNRAAFYGLALGALAMIVPARANAWAHQTHLISTRLAVWQMVNDPTTPKGLRDFVAANCAHDLKDVEALALHTTVASDPSAFTAPLEHWVTWPDVYKVAGPGRAEIPMHYIYLEDFAAHPFYADDLSNQPALTDVPNNPADPRYKTAGTLPLRAAECYDKAVAQFAKPGPGADDEAQWVAYLAHYVQEATQPHHTTIDTKGITDFAGVVPGVPASASQPSAGGRLASLRTPGTPHSDIEFALFKSDLEPIESYRQQFWTALQADMESLAKHPPAHVAADAKSFDAFTWEMGIILDSYDDLPFVGHASAAAYKTGKFDPKAYFEFEGTVAGQKMTMVQFIAYQHAVGAVATEQAWRRAWEAGRGSDQRRGASSRPAR